MQDLEEVNNDKREDDVREQSFDDAAPCTRSRGAVYEEHLRQESGVATSNEDVD